MSDWLNKDRSETYLNRISPRAWKNDLLVENPALGINIYKGVLDKTLSYEVINVLESNIDNEKYQWSQAHVTESDNPLLNARDCLDFKVGHNNLGPRNSKNKELYDMHKKVFDALYPASQDYSKYWGVGISYFEVFNFVKYDGINKHFNIHADHGPAYVSTVSMVLYVNDNYEGGELYFPRFDLEIKPEAGDLVIFPSTYIYEHASKPIVSGIKYAIVIMTDYNSRGNLRYYPYREEDNEVTY